LCQRGDVDFLAELLDLPSSQPFIDDLEIMTVAVARDSKLFAMASPGLQNSPQLIFAAITPTSAWDTLKVIPSALLRQHPEIPTRAIEVTLKRNMRYLQAHIPDDIWATHKPLCLAWLKRGGRVLEAFEPLLAVQPPFSHDDLVLPFAVARYNWTEFYKVGDALLRDREFMLEALTIEGRIILFAPATLRQEFDVQVVAVANHNNTAIQQSSIAVALGSVIDIPKLQHQIQERLQLHQTFFQDFLRGIAIVEHHQPPQLRSHLPMLDRGVETSQAFKRLIAEYLGVPFGRHLFLLRQADTNLKLSEEVPQYNRNIEDDRADFWNMILIHQPPRTAIPLPLGQPIPLARRQRNRARQREGANRAREVMDRDRIAQHQRRFVVRGDEEEQFLIEDDLFNFDLDAAL